MEGGLAGGYLSEGSLSEGSSSLHSLSDGEDEGQAGGDTPRGHRTPGGSGTHVHASPASSTHRFQRMEREIEAELRMLRGQVQGSPEVVQGPPEVVQGSPEVVQGPPEAQGPSQVQGPGTPTALRRARQPSSTPTANARGPASGEEGVSPVAGGCGSPVVQSPSQRAGSPIVRRTQTLRQFMDDSKRAEDGGLRV